MYKLIGKCISQGEYNGKPYKKICLHVQLCDVPSNYSQVEGVITDVIRAPYNEEFSKLRINDRFNLFYDKYGRPLATRKE